MDDIKYFLIAEVVFTFLFKSFYYWTSDLNFYFNFFTLYIFATWWCKPLIFKFIEQNSYQRSMPSIDWKIWVFDNNSVLLNFIIGSELFEYSTIRRPRKHLFDYTGHLCKELKRLFYLVKIHSFLFKFEYLKGVLAKN